MVRLRNLFLAISLALCLPCCPALKGSTYLTNQVATVSVLSNFGFYEGGIGDFSVTLEREPLFEGEVLVGMCRQTHLDIISSEAALSSEGSSVLNDAFCESNICGATAVKPSGLLTETFVAARTELYYFCVIRCNKAAGNTDGLYTYQFTNNGHHLGFEDDRKPDFFAAILWIWVAIFVLWSSNMLSNKEQITDLHKLLTVLPVVKMVLLVQAWVFWSRLDETGDADQVISSIFPLTAAVHIMLFYLCLCVIAKGWIVLRPSLTPGEKRQVFASVGFFSFMWLLVVQVSQYLLILLVVAYFSLVVFIFSSINRNCSALRAQLFLIYQANINPLTTPAYFKLRILQHYRVVVGFYVFVEMCTYVIFMMWVKEKDAWISEVIVDVIQIILAIGVGWTLRLRRHSPYLTVEEEVRVDRFDLDVNGIPDMNNNADNPLTPWEQGMTYPGAPMNLLHPSDRTLVVVQHPGDHNGVGDVAIGTFVQMPQPDDGGASMMKGDNRRNSNDGTTTTNNNNPTSNDNSAANSDHSAANNGNGRSNNNSDSV